MQRFTAWYFWGSSIGPTELSRCVAAFEMAAVITPDTVSPRDKSETYRQWGLALFALNDLEEALKKLKMPSL